MSLTFHLLRHGQTECSRENVFCGAGSDPDLTSDGRAMGTAFAEYYRTFPWEALYASPLRRTLQTAALITPGVDKPIQYRDQLKEISYGKWERLTVEAVSRKYPDDHHRWLADPAWNAPTEGERAITVARRAMETIEEIKSRITGGNVLLVTHKATIRIIVCVLLGIDLGRYRSRLACPVGSLTSIEITADGPCLRGLADTSHLSQELRSLPGT